jgi:hypothetical protein
MNYKKNLYIIFYDELYIMDCNNSNGRVNIISPDTNTLFAMTDRIPVSECTDFRDAMTGNWYNTILSDSFFSGANVQILQNGIRAGVYKKSNGMYVVGNQDCDELKIIMRSMFLQYAKNLPTDITGQIQELNNLVLNYAIKQVYGEAEGYIKYKRDASTMYTPIARPVMSKTNDKQLVLKKWF